MADLLATRRTHYDVSMKIAELVPAARRPEAAEETIIAAPGTSCRHQVKDGTGKKALHPAEILLEARRLINNTRSKFC